MHCKANAMQSKEPVAGGSHSLAALLLRNFIISNNLLQIPIPKSQPSEALLWCDVNAFTHWRLRGHWSSCHRQMSTCLPLLNTFKLDGTKGPQSIGMHYIGVILYGLMVMSSATEEGEAKVEKVSNTSLPLLQQGIVLLDLSLVLTRGFKWHCFFAARVGIRLASLRERPRQVGHPLRVDPRRQVGRARQFDWRGMFCCLSLYSAEMQNIKVYSNAKHNFPHLSTSTQY